MTILEAGVTGEEGGVIIDAVTDLSDTPAAAQPESLPPFAPAERLVARRPFTWMGRLYQKGEALDPVPTGRKREVLARAGFIVAEVAPGLSDVVAQVQAIVPDGLVCSQCAKVFKTPVGLKVHTTRVHGGP